MKLSPLRNPDTSSECAYALIIVSTDETTFEFFEDEHTARREAASILETAYKDEEPMHVYAVLVRKQGSVSK